jgi:hypothetical protein
MEEGGASRSSLSLEDGEEMTLDKDTPTESKAYEGKGKEKKKAKSAEEKYTSLLVKLCLPQDEREIGMWVLEKYKGMRRTTPERLRELMRFYYTGYYMCEKKLRCNANSGSKLTNHILQIPGLPAKISVHFTELKTFLILSETSKKVRAFAISAAREHEGTLKFTPSLTALLRLCDKEREKEKKMDKVSLELGLELDVKFKLDEDGRHSFGNPWTEWQRGQIARRYITIFSRFPMCEFYIRVQRGEISTHIAHRNTVFNLIHFLLRVKTNNKACMVDQKTLRRGPTFCLGSFNDPYLGPLPFTRIKTLEVVFPVRPKPTPCRKRKIRDENTDKEPQDVTQLPPPQVPPQDVTQLPPPQAPPQDATQLPKETSRSYENEEQWTKIAMMKIMITRTENIIFSTWTSAPLVYLALKEVTKTERFLEMRCHLL